MSNLDSEVTLQVREFSVVPAHTERADNVRIKSSALRGVARVREADGRKGLVFSTLSAFVLSLVGSIHEHPSRHGFGRAGRDPAQA